MSEEEEIWNPALGLYQSLLDAQKKSYTPTKQPRLIRAVWALVFNLDEKDTISIYRKLAALSDALNWTENQLALASFRGKENFTRNLGNIRRLLNKGDIDNHWVAVESLLTEATMADLLHASQRVGDISAEAEMTRAEFEQLFGELDRLISVFNRSDLDEELRIAIMDLLEASRQMLSDYRIRGSAALQGIIELAIGKMMTKREKFAAARKSGKLTQLFDWLKRIDDVFARTTKYGPLLKGATQIFLGTESDSQS